jgi:hypothetical protein
VGPEVSFRIGISGAYAIFYVYFRDSESNFLLLNFGVTPKFSFEIFLMNLLGITTLEISF